MAKENKTEQIRNLENTVILSGILAELDPSTIKYGKGSDGVDYVSFKGAIQCHEEDTSLTAYFSTFIKAKKQNGEKSKTYDSAVKWVKSAIPMTKDKENATLVSMQGSLTCNNYVGSDGQFKENFVNNIQFFNKFNDYAWDMRIEGYITDIEDVEDEDGNNTGKKKVYLIGKDFFNNAIIFGKKNPLIANKEVADYFDDAEYEKGRTAVINCSRVHSGEAPKPKKGGFGKSVVTTGAAPLMWEIVGGDSALDEDDDNALTSQQIKLLTAEYKKRNEEIIEKGYQGGKKDEKKKSTKKAEKFEELDDFDPDMPF